MNRVLQPLGTSRPLSLRERAIGAIGALMNRVLQPLTLAVLGLNAGGGPLGPFLGPLGFECSQHM